MPMAHGSICMNSATIPLVKCFDLLNGGLKWLPLLLLA